MERKLTSMKKQLRKALCDVAFVNRVFLKCLISYYITLARDEPHVLKDVRSVDYVFRF